MLEQRRWWQAGSSVWGPYSNNENGTNDRYKLQSYGSFVVGFLVAASVFPIISMSAAGWLGVGMMWFPVVGTTMAMFLGTAVALAARTALPHFANNYGNPGYLNSRIGDHLATLGVMAQSAAIGFFTGAVMGKAIEHIAKKEGVARWVGGTFAAIAMAATTQKLYEWSAPEEIYRLNRLPLKESIPTWQKVRRAVLGGLIAATVLTGIATAIVLTYGAAAFILAPIALTGAVTGGLSGYYINLKRKHTYTAGPDASIEDRYLQENMMHKFYGVIANINDGNSISYKIKPGTNVWEVSFKRNLHDSQPFLTLPIYLDRLPAVHKRILQTLLAPADKQTGKEGAAQVCRDIIFAFASINHNRAERQKLILEVTKAKDVLEKLKPELIKKLRAQGHTVNDTDLDSQHTLQRFTTTQSQTIIQEYQQAQDKQAHAQDRLMAFYSYDAAIIKPRQCINITPSKRHTGYWNFYFNSILPAIAGEKVVPTTNADTYKYRINPDNLPLDLLLELQRVEALNSQAQSYMNPNLMFHPDGVIDPTVIEAEVTLVAAKLKDYMAPTVAEDKTSTLRRIVASLLPQQISPHALERTHTSGVLVGAIGQMGAAIAMPAAGTSIAPTSQAASAPPSLLPSPLGRRSYDEDSMIGSGHGLQDASRRSAQTLASATLQYTPSTEDIEVTAAVPRTETGVTREHKQKFSKVERFFIGLFRKKSTKATVHPGTSTEMVNLPIPHQQSDQQPTTFRRMNWTQHTQMHRGAARTANLA